MRYARYIFVLLFVLSYRGLSAQEFDLYDFRYYKRFDTVEELLAADTDSVAVDRINLNRHFTTRALDYNLSIVQFARRGRANYERRTTLNGVEIPFIGEGTIRALQLAVNRVMAPSHIADGGEVSLSIDTLHRVQTSIGTLFSSRTTPYSLQFFSAHRLNHGWSLATNMATKTGRNLHIEGVFGNSLEIDAVATKQFGDRGMLSIAIFANPSMRSSRSASTAEAFRLIGNNLYNPSWGYHNGKVRSSRVRREFLPTVFVGYEGVLTERIKLNVSAAITAGVERYSALDWYGAQTPAPDNYRYVPSYFEDETDIFSSVESAWRNNDTRYTQIDFDRLVATNALNGGETVYAIADRVERLVKGNFRVGATTTFGKNTLLYGVDIKIVNSRNYKQMRDLLGGEYIADLDYFLLDDDTYGNSLQNNLISPNRRIENGDRFGYDYAIRRYDASLFGVYRYAVDKLSLDVAAAVGYTNISRRGFYQKELFADSSLGVSRKLKFSPYSLRTTVEYLAAESHFLRGVVALESKSCDAESYFLQSEYNNRTIDAPAMRSSYGAELQYIFQIPKFTLSTTLFISADRNDTQVRHLYDDLSGEYADIVNSKINSLRYGLEVEAEYRFIDHFRATAAIALGRYKYANNSLVTIYSDSSNRLIADHVESLTAGLSLGNMPQVAATAGLSYYNRGWYANVNFNYAGLRYVDPSAMMRTKRVLLMATSPEQYNELTTQERLGDAFTIDLSLSKTLYLSRLSKRIYSTKAVPRFEDKYPRSRLVFRVGVNNMLGSTSVVYRGYESSRLQRYKLAGEYIYDRQATRYLYAYPRTFYASVVFVF